MTTPHVRRKRWKFIVLAVSRLMVALLSFLGGLAIAIPAATSQQSSGKAARVGYLGVAPRPPDEAFIQGLRDLGYREGESVRIEYRFGGNNELKMTEAAEGLVRSNVDVLVAVSSPATRGGPGRVWLCQ
jgi:putative tryptophan/tyrosine transport system substrate-binding protein